MSNENQKCQCGSPRDMGYLGTIYDELCGTCHKRIDYKAQRAAWEESQVKLTADETSSSKAASTESPTALAEMEGEVFKIKQTLSHVQAQLTTLSMHSSDEMARKRSGELIDYLDRNLDLLKLISHEPRQATPKAVGDDEAQYALKRAFRRLEQIEAWECGACSTRFSVNDDLDLIRRALESNGTLQPTSVSSENLARSDASELVNAAKRLLEAWNEQRSGKPKVSISFKMALNKIRQLVEGN